MRRAKVYVNSDEAGLLTEDNSGSYIFQYSRDYLEKPHATPVSLTLPLTADIYTSSVLFPFFDGLIPEGWLLDLSAHNWKLKTQDRMGLLLAVCQDCIGNVGVYGVDDG